jgi:hypothetical protein
MTASRMENADLKHASSRAVSVNRKITGYFYNRNQNRHRLYNNRTLTLTFRAHVTCAPKPADGQGTGERHKLFFSGGVWGFAPATENIC